MRRCRKGSSGTNVEGDYEVTVLLFNLDYSSIDFSSTRSASVFGEH